MHQSIPISDFAIVYDIERNMVIDCGTYEDCENYANLLNREYHSTAYQMRPWVFQN